MAKFQFFPKRYGFFPYIFLFYLTMPAYYMMNTEGIKQIIGYSFLVLFLISYRQLFWFPPIRIYSIWLAIQIVLICILTIWYSPYNLFLGFFPANHIGWYEKKEHFNRSLLIYAFALVMTVLVLAIREGIQATIFILPFLVVMLMSPFGIRSMNERMELEKELDQANEQIKEFIKREERTRIARDLHDTLGHTLSLITLQSQLVQRLVEKQPERAKEEAKEIEVTSRSALRQVRELVSNMRAITIAEELQNLQQILLAAGIECRLEKTGHFKEIQPLQQNIIGMCLKEAGTNIVKHSQASMCTVIFSHLNGAFQVSVRDNGTGFQEKDKLGNGLNGMRERLALIDGNLTVQSTEEGTTVEMVIPIVMKQEEIAL